MTQLDNLLRVFSDYRVFNCSTDKSVIEEPIPPYVPEFALSIVVWKTSAGNQTHVFVREHVGDCEPRIIEFLFDHDGVFQGCLTHSYEELT